MVYPHSYRTEHSETKTTNCVYGDYYAQHQSKKIPIQPKLLKIIQYVDSNRYKFVDDLAEAVAIKSVSGHLKYRDEVQKMIKFTEDWLFKLGLKYERFDIGFHEIEGETVRLPTIILASLGNNPNKKTVCVYTYLDVQNPDEGKWICDPWKVTLIDKKYYGSGVASGKGALLQWFHMIEAFQFSKLELPVNLKFIIESMYQHDSTGLAEFLPLRKHDFFFDIDNIIVCESEWVGEKYPCIVYGTVGILHYNIFIEKTPDSKTDPKDDMVTIFKEMVDEEERILVPRFHDIVTQITPEEEKIYEAIKDFNIEEVRKNLPPFKQQWDQVKLLMNYWRLPSMWVDETEECECEKKDSNIFKRHFVIKIVPRQIIERTTKLTIEHVDNIAKKHKIENKVKCEVVSATRYWYENVRSPLYEAARRATIQIYKEDPNMIREDRARKLLTILDRVLERSILLLPLATSSSNIGNDNENILGRNFIESLLTIGNTANYVEGVMGMR